MKRILFVLLVLAAATASAQQIMPYYRLAWIPPAGGACAGIGLYQNESRTRELWIYQKNLPSLECPDNNGIDGVTVVLTWDPAILTITNCVLGNDVPGDWDVSWADCSGQTPGVKFEFGGSTVWEFMAEWKHLATFTLRGVSSSDCGWVNFRRDPSNCETEVHAVGGAVSDAPSCTADIGVSHDLCEAPGGGTNVPFYTHSIYACSITRPQACKPPDFCDEVSPPKPGPPTAVSAETWGRVKSLYR